MYARAKNPSFHLLGPAVRLKLPPWNQMWRGHFLCSVAPRLYCASLPCLLWGKCRVVPYIIILLNYHEPNKGPDEWSAFRSFSATASAVIHLHTVLLFLPQAFRSLISELSPDTTRVEVMVGSPLRLRRRPISSQHPPRSLSDKSSKLEKQYWVLSTFKDKSTGMFL